MVRGVFKSVQLIEPPQRAIVRVGLKYRQASLVVNRLKASSHC